MIPSRVPMWSRALIAISGAFALLFAGTFIYWQTDSLPKVPEPVAEGLLSLAGVLCMFAPNPIIWFVPHYPGRLGTALNAALFLVLAIPLSFFLGKFLAHIQRRHTFVVSLIVYGTISAVLFLAEEYIPDWVDTLR